jgi:hypothetical protein
MTGISGKVVQFQYVPEDAKTEAAVYVLLDNGQLWLRSLTGPHAGKWAEEALPPNALVGR